AASCQTVDNSTAGRSTGATGGKSWNAGRGLQVNEPSYDGQFQLEDAEQVSRIFVAGRGRMIVLGRAAHIGDVELDDPAMTNAILAPSGASFPSQNVRRMEPVVVDGQRMLIFQEIVNAEKGEALRCHVGIRNGPWLHSFLVLATPDATEIDRAHATEF